MEVTVIRQGFSPSMFWEKMTVTFPKYVLRIKIRKAAAGWVLMGSDIVVKVRVGGDVLCI